MTPTKQDLLRRLKSITSAYGSSNGIEQPALIYEYMIELNFLLAHLVAEEESNG